MINITGGSNYEKIILTALALGVLAGGVGFSNSQTPLSAQASTAYTWGKPSPIRIHSHFTMRENHLFICGASITQQNSII